METEKTNLKIEPEQKTTQANEQKSEREADEPASPPVVQPLNTEGGEPKPGESYDETDRKQDETLQTIAKQTKWEEKQAEALEEQTGLMRKQTVWIKRQAIWTGILTFATLVVLVYHGMMMRGQLAQMESSSNQTQDMLRATQKQADASTLQANTSQGIVEQNGELVRYAGEQANASRTQAEASTKQANASLAQAEIAKQSLGFAASAARASEQSARIATESFSVGERAYIAVDDMKMPKVAVGQTPLVTTYFVNGGRTPAYHFTPYARISFHAQRESPSPIWHPDARPHDYGFLNAGRGVKVIFKADWVITEERFAAMNNGSMKLFVEIEAHYLDSLGRTQTYASCGVYDPSIESFAECEQ